MYRFCAANLVDGIVLVSETNSEVDANGTLHALNATDGVSLWSLKASITGGSGSLGLYYIPAIDET
jgi:outer membrane protein assembly factor BamB